MNISNKKLLKNYETWATVGFLYHAIFAVAWFYMFLFGSSGEKAIPLWVMLVVGGTFIAITALIHTGEPTADLRLKRQDETVFWLWLAYITMYAISVIIAGMTIVPRIF